MLVVGSCVACGKADKDSNNNECKKAIPDIESIFTDGKLSTICIKDDGSAYCIRVINYTEDEYDKYVKKCKDMDWVASYEGYAGDWKFTYMDKDNKEYSLQVVMVDKDQMDILCKKTK